MTDRQLQQDTLAALVIICLVAMAFFFTTSKAYQRQQFLKDCGDTYSQEHCLELWRMGNG